MAGNLVPLTTIFTTPGFTNEAIHIFQATGLTLGAVLRDEDEFMEVVEVPLSRVMSMIRSGEICDNKSLTGILLMNHLRTLER